MPVGSTPHRRPHEGRPRLVYLDQSILSDLACSPEHDVLRDLLLERVTEGAIICPTSEIHVTESSRAGEDRARSIRALAEDLSDGIHFRAIEEIEALEIVAAVEAFLEMPLSIPLWKEAFDADPSAPSSARHPTGFRLSVMLDPTNAMLVEDAEYEQQVGLALAPVWATSRAEGRSFERNRILEMASMIDWKLGPLVQSERYARQARVTLEAASRDAREGGDPMRAGSPFRRAEMVSAELARCRQLAEHFPSLDRDGWGRFARSPNLAELPTIAILPSLLAAMATERRAPRTGDFHDLQHLSLGLGRCHIVVADGSMTQLVRTHRLGPNGVQMFATREREQFKRLIERL